MLGPKQEAQSALFYDFSIEDHVPQDHILRSIDRFVDLSSIRQHLAPFYSSTGFVTLTQMHKKAEVSRDHAATISHHSVNALARV